MAGPTPGRDRPRRGRRRRRAPWSAAALACCLAAGACGGAHNRGAAADPTPSTTVGPVVTLRLGLLTAAPAGGFGVDHAVATGVRLAVSEFDGASQGMNVVIDARSTGGTAAGAEGAARRLVADHVVAVLGPQTAEELSGAAPVLSAAGVADLTVTATAPSLAQQGWATFFRAVADDQQQGVDDGDELVAKLGAKSLALVGDGGGSDTSLLSAAASEATGLGASILQQTSIASAVGAMAEAEAVTAAKPAGVLVAAAPALARAVIADLEADGYHGAVLCAAAGPSPSTTLAALGTQADGVYLSSPAVDDTASTRGQAGDSGLVFADAYQAAFGQPPPAWSAEAFDATNFVLAALSAHAGSVAAYLRTGRWVGVGATLSFGSDGDELDPPVFVAQVRNGSLAPAVSVAVSAAGAKPGAGGGAGAAGQPPASGS